MGPLSLVGDIVVVLVFMFCVAVIAVSQRGIGAVPVPIARLVTLSSSGRSEPSRRSVLAVFGLFALAVAVAQLYDAVWRLANGQETVAVVRGVQLAAEAAWIAYVMRSSR